MAIAFEKYLQQTAGRLKSGPVGKFLGWWAEELKQVLPASWQHRLHHAQRRVTLLPRHGSLNVAVDENRKLEALEDLVIVQDTAVQQQQLHDLLLDNELLETPRFLLLESGSVLGKELKLPLAAESNLFQVLSFEMDRQTPFRAADVYFDWKELDRDREAGQLRLELFLVPRAEVDEIIKSSAVRGVTLSGIDVVDGGKTLGLNLLPRDQRPHVVNRKSRLNYALGTAAVLLLALVMAQSLYLRQHQISELEAAIAEVQGEARQVMQIRERIEDSSEAAGFLTIRRIESPLAIEILKDVTRILPDDTYLDRLVIGTSSVQMQGKSQNAQQLIELVNQSELLEAAAFRGSTRLDARSGLEIFEVNAQIVQAGGG